MKKKEKKMIKKISLIIFSFFALCNYTYSSENDCSNFKKLSINYIKCKANLAKEKTLSAGQNFVEDTKEFQKKEWSDEKKKMDGIKKKVLGE